LALIVLLGSSVSSVPSTMLLICRRLVRLAAPLTAVLTLLYFLFRAGLLGGRRR
jgi:transcriptional regulator GlxA family with amidase domain